MDRMLLEKGVVHKNLSFLCKCSSVKKTTSMPTVVQTMCALCILFITVLSHSPDQLTCVLKLRTVPRVQVERAYYRELTYVHNFYVKRLIDTWIWAGDPVVLRNA